MFRHRLALFVVLVFGMSAGTDGADNHVLGTQATGKLKLIRQHVEMTLKTRMSAGKRVKHI